MSTVLVRPDEAIRNLRIGVINLADLKLVADYINDLEAEVGYLRAELKGKRS